MTSRCRVLWSRAECQQLRNRPLSNVVKMENRPIISILTNGNCKPRAKKSNKTDEGNGCNVERKVSCISSGPTVVYTITRVLVTRYHVREKIHFIVNLKPKCEALINVSSVRLNSKLLEQMNSKFTVLSFSIQTRYLEAVDSCQRLKIYA